MKPLPYARKKEILEMLKRNDFIDINQLSRKFNVSYMTIHRDLKELESAGVVSRIYGGAVALDSPKAEGRDAASQEASQKNSEPFRTVPLPADLTLEERFALRQDAKRAIAAEAASFVEDGDVIGMDASTSALQMCPFLHEKNITVVTNSLHVALQFSDSGTVDVLLVGGLLRKSSLSLGGVRDQGLLQYVNIDKCFFSCSAISFEKGMTELHLEECESKRDLIRRTDRLFVLADHTKIGGGAPYVDCTSDRIHTLITDRYDKLDKGQVSCLEEFEHSGVRVIRAAEK